jgi:hypothetical protein
MRTSDRYRRGERHHAATCSDHEVALALELVRYRVPVSVVAAKFGVAKMTVYRWLKGQSRDM